MDPSRANSTMFAYATDTMQKKRRMKPKAQRVPLYLDNLRKYRIFFEKYEKGLI